MQLPLVDDAAFVRMQKFNRIFDRQHVIGLLAVNLVDDRRQRRRFSRTGRTRHQHDAVAQPHNLL